MSGKVLAQLGTEELLQEAYSRADERAWKLADLALAAMDATPFVLGVRLGRLEAHLTMGRAVTPRLCAVGEVARRPLLEVRQ